MGDMWETEDPAVKRSRELKSLGLGDFVSLVAEVEALPEQLEPEITARPGAQTVSVQLSDDDLSRFEAQFLQGTAPTEEPHPRERSSSVSFASAFQIVQSQRAESHQSRTGELGAKGLNSDNRFAAFVSDRGGAVAAEGPQIVIRPRPEGGSTFDLGAYYDRIGLESDEASALTRILAHAEKAQGAILDPEADAAMIEQLMRALEVDPDAEPSPEPAAEQDGDAEAELTLVLDGALARSLIAAAQARGVPAEETAVEALRAVYADLPDLAEAPAPTRLAVPEEPPIAGSAPFAAA